MKKLIYDIKLEANQLSQKSDEELDLSIQAIKQRAKNEPVEHVITKWFALTQEVSYRRIGLKHFDTQLLAGLLLHQGKIVEMKTGEGKTLVSTLPVALNALTGKGVHVVTVNDYLAERDKKWMGKVYNGLGLSVGLVKSNSQTLDKQKSYQADITYVTNSEVVFDYLRDSSAYNLNEIVQRPFHYCLIDEIDSVLIDESRTPLILSAFKDTDNLNKLYLAKAIANILEEDLHFQLDEKRKDINLTEKGYQETKRRLGKKTLYDPDDPWILEILNALKAKYFFKLNKDYIVLNNKIVIVDEFTGRIMEDRRWSMGLHEAVEIKEGVDIGGGTKTKSAITYQNFFTLYPTLAGMTGTAKTTEKEFKDIYNLDVVVLPTVKPLIRQDLPDYVYQTELAKWKAVLNQSKECYQKGQPILIGTASIEKSEFLADLFKISKIPHQILNAKPENVTRESEIVAQAGQRYAVTIATNMAGRGTDIILGGNPAYETKQILWETVIEEKKVDGFSYTEQIKEIRKKYIQERNLKQLEEEIQTIPGSLEECSKELNWLYNSVYQTISAKCKDENLKVKEIGGLYVLGTERHETRRIDNQLRGRAGRQGDPGASQFFVSLEDELIKIFGGDSIKKWVSYLIQDDETPLESDLLTKSLENAQKKVELYNYELRKNVFQYDDILNSQRKQLFQGRAELIFQNRYEELFLRYTETFFDEELQINAISSQENFEKAFDSYSKYEKGILNKPTQEVYQEIWISQDLRFAHSNFYQLGFLKNTRSTTLLSIIDFYWTEHLDRMNYIRETINWRSYGQQNPLIEYNIEAFQSFKLMFEQIRSAMIYYFLNNPISY
jgi:preprotein translocase subunit SecA